MKTNYTYLKSGPVLIVGFEILHNGRAGSGKTMLLCKMVNEVENPTVLAFTNKALENVKNRLVRKKYMRKEDADVICFTFYSYIFEWKGRDLSSLKCKTIFLEEFPMIPNK